MSFKKNTKKDLVIKQFQKIKSNVVDGNSWIMLQEYHGVTDQVKNFKNGLFGNDSELGMLGLNETGLSEGSSRQKYRALCNSVKDEYGTGKKARRDSAENSESDLEDDENDNEQNLGKRSKSTSNNKLLIKEIERLKKSNNELLELCHMMEMT